jgi:hypothetical protein
MFVIRLERMMATETLSWAFTSTQPCLCNGQCLLSGVVEVGESLCGGLIQLLQ